MEEGVGDKLVKLRMGGVELERPGGVVGEDGRTSVDEDIIKTYKNCEIENDEGIIHQRSAAQGVVGANGNNHISITAQFRWGLIIS